jgi:hypothetical protein
MRKGGPLFPSAEKIDTILAGGLAAAGQSTTGRDEPGGDGKGVAHGGA